MVTIVSFRSALFGAALLLPALAAPAFAGEARDKADRTSEWTFEISAGVKYDSNLSVIEIDQVVPDDDFAAVIKASVDYLLKITPQTTLKVGYDFDQSLYSEHDEFNYQSHAGSAKLRHKFGAEADASDVALNYRYSYSTLDGDGFMNLHRISPTLGVYIAKPVYLLFEYIYADKDFIGITDRDAVVHSGGVDAFYFIDGPKFMIVAGYQYDDSDANDVDFDYEAHLGKIKLVRRVDVAGVKPKFSVGWDHETRNYSSPTSAAPDAAGRRNDNRNKLKASLEVPVTDVFYALFEYQYRDFNSNLNAADYSENLVEVRVGAEF